MFCNRCIVLMKSGTSYKQMHGEYTAQRYNECPKCKCKTYENLPNFQVTLKSAIDNMR